nr:hypothetical protein [Tanacetum cinerariifolium]
MLLCKQEEDGIQLNAEKADWRDDTDDDELEDQELEAHYMYMAKIQEVSPDAVDSGLIFDTEPEQKLFLGTVKFGNDQIAPILGYGDLGNDLQSGSRGTDLYSITLQATDSPNPICLVAKATSSQAWLWHRRLSHLNFDTINLLSKNDIVTMALNHDSLSLANQRQANVPQADRTLTTSNELDLLFSPMFDELLNGSSKAVAKPSVVSAVDAPNQRQQHTTPLNNHTTPAPTCQVQSLASTVSSSENINQAEMHAENDQVADDEFINIFQPRSKTKGRRRHVMLIRQICTLSINDIPLNIVGQKIIH